MKKFKTSLSTSVSKGTSTSPSTSVDRHKHLWAVRNRENGDTRFEGATIYFCKYCLEVKKVSDE